MSFLLVATLLLPISGAYAANKVYPESVIEIINTQSDKLIKYLKANISESDPHILVENFLKNNRIKLPPSTKNVLIKALSNSRCIYVLKSINLGNNCYITFLNNGDFYLDELKVKQLKYPYPHNLITTKVQNNRSYMTGQTHYAPQMTDTNIICSMYGCIEYT